MIHSSGFYPPYGINPVAGFACLAESHACRQIAKGLYRCHSLHYQETNGKIDPRRSRHIDKSIYFESHKVHHTKQNIVHQIDGQGQRNHGYCGQDFAFFVAVLLEKQEHTRRQNDFKASALRLECSVIFPCRHRFPIGAHHNGCKQHNDPNDLDPVGNLLFE